jgi:hypothetical protein
MQPPGSSECPLTVEKDSTEPGVVRLGGEYVPLTQRDTNDVVKVPPVLILHVLSMRSPTVWTTGPLQSVAL